MISDAVLYFRDESEEQVEEACEVMSDAFDVTYEGNTSTVVIPTSTPSKLPRHPQSSVPPSSLFIVETPASTAHASMSAENKQGPPAKSPLFPLPEDTFLAKKQKAELALLEAKIAAADAKRKAFEMEAEYKSLLISQFKTS